MNLVPANGRLIAGWDSPHVREVVGEMGQKLLRQLETFGTAEDAKWRMSNVDFSNELSKFSVTCEASSG